MSNATRRFRGMRGHRACATAAWLLVGIGHVASQQIDIPRIELMPNKPAPYQMRNWKQVALGYDSLVFDLSRTGRYLPLIWTYSSTVNYPEHGSFGLHSYVGTRAPRSAEAINVIPAVIGATLVGVDKRNQWGHNWVLMCEEFFNRRPEENVYLNGPVASSGQDWWYDTMPNVFFYQLSYLYPHTGDFDYQFRMVADRWLEAVKAMGGSTTPWRKPFMGYRAFNLSTMTPLASGVPEPEAAGAIAWLLYNAYVVTGESKYRIGAEWCLEFLESRSTNPSYELQLPYGVYAAARMNAELGTSYNIQKLLNWCFDPSQNVRDWGATIGNWGGYDCAGLIGEAKYSGYAFVMNGFQMACALVPMVRYDDRFARAIGKWMLNCANASRLFYTNYLPDDRQDSEEWAHQYDPHSYLAHEALRQHALHTGVSPYATGDAIEGGWAATNLALYGSSHVGIFGGIIDTTEVPMILRLDVLKTDFFHAPAYPTYLYFNPYDTDQRVTVTVGPTPCDLYEVVSNFFVAYNVTGSSLVTIPANSAILLVLAPAGGAVSFELDKTLIDGVVVDYRSGQPVGNYPPRIKSLDVTKSLLVFGEAVDVYCTAVDRDGGSLTYEWSATGGTLQGSGNKVSWVAPSEGGKHTISCRVLDTGGASDSSSVRVEVVAFINHPPRIRSLEVSPRKVGLGEVATVVCSAWDEDGDSLSFAWSASGGMIDAIDSSATWTAPAAAGLYVLRCIVSDPHGGQASDSIGVVVQDPTNPGCGIPVAYYPFHGDARDESGFGHHGSVHGAQLTADRFGNANSAYAFDGDDDNIRVPNTTTLNFQDEISISLWMNVVAFGGREQYPISHGSWDNRWKISLIPEKRVRWTIKTDRGVKDLDSRTEIIPGRFYNVIAIFDGTRMALYLDGNLDSRADWSGRLMTTTIDLTIGQMLPHDSGYNFAGVLDDIRIFSYALSTEEIANLVAEGTAVHDSPGPLVPSQFVLFQSYPNPFSGKTTIEYGLPSATADMCLRIVDVLGREVVALARGPAVAGFKEVAWDGNDALGRPAPSGLYFVVLTAKEERLTRKVLLLR
ncbi:MAG: T9SS type A sorting domain-containing protein [candidate division KSB1 bacterium]|nr:T9SS type A sorting domain-containing protein [candidate division KSB1 bacterium]